MKMDSPTEPLQCLPKQPLKSPTGARLVLSTTDAGYPDRATPRSPGRGSRWFDNIAGTDAMEFFKRGMNYFPDFSGNWQWPAVVLMPEEYNLRVGCMSVTELQSKLEEYWGRGAVPGAAADDAYEDMWVPAWSPDRRDPYSLSWHVHKKDKHPPLDPIVFSRWVNGECAKWLSYFIAKNHTLGAVHAWFAAFLGVTISSLPGNAESLGGTVCQQFLASNSACHLTCVWNTTMRQSMAYPHPFTLKPQCSKEYGLLTSTSSSWSQEGYGIPVQTSSFLQHGFRGV